MKDKKIKTYLPFYVVTSVLIIFVAFMFKESGVDQHIPINVSFCENQISGKIYPGRLRPDVFSISNEDSNFLLTSLNRPCGTKKMELFLEQNLNRGDFVFKAKNSDSLLLYKKDDSDKRNYLLILSKRMVVEIKGQKVRDSTNENNK